MIERVGNIVWVLVCTFKLWMGLSRRARSGVWQKHDLLGTTSKKGSRVLAQKELRNDWLGCSLESVLDRLVDCFYAHSVQVQYTDAPISARLWTLENSTVDVRVRQAEKPGRLLVEVVLTSGDAVDVSTLARDIIRAAEGNLNIRDVVKQRRDDLFEWKNEEEIHSRAEEDFHSFVQKGVGHRTGDNLRITLRAIDDSLASRECEVIQSGLQELVGMSDYMDSKELEKVARAVLKGDASSDIRDESLRIRQSLLSFMKIPNDEETQGLSTHDPAGVAETQKKFLTVLALTCFINLLLTEDIVEAFLRYIAVDFVETLFDLISLSAAEKHIGYMAARTLNHVFRYKSAHVPHPEKLFYHRVASAVKTGSLSHCLLESECSTLIFAMTDKGVASSNGPPIARNFRDEKSRSISDGSGGSGSSEETASTYGSNPPHGLNLREEQPISA